MCIRDSHTAQRKVLRIAHGKGAGKLQHKICTRTKRRLCTRTGLVHGGHTALGKAAAHQAKDQRIRQALADELKLMLMTAVKGIVFTNYADNRSHRIARSAKSCAFLGCPLPFVIKKMYTVQVEVRMHGMASPDEPVPCIVAHKGGKKYVRH